MEIERITHVGRGFIQYFIERIEEESDILI